MKHFRLRPGYWFSAFALLFLVLMFNRPDGNTVTPSADVSGQTVTAYRVVSDENEQWLEPFAARLAPKTEPMVGALSAMTLLKPEESPFPPETRVLSVAAQGGGVAWADFNVALVANFPGGSTRESLTVQAILRTLGQFPGVRAVQITVEGRKIESIGGHFDVSDPQPVPDPNEGGKPSRKAAHRAANYSK